MRSEPRYFIEFSDKKYAVWTLRYLRRVRKACENFDGFYPFTVIREMEPNETLMQARRWLRKKQAK